MLALASALACGGGGGSGYGDGERLTIEEYGKACRDLEVSYAAEYSYSFVSGPTIDLKEHMDEIDQQKIHFQQYKDLNPPEPLEKFHKARTKLLEFAVDKRHPIRREVLEVIYNYQLARDEGDEEELRKFGREHEKLQEKGHAQIPELEELSQKMLDEKLDLSLTQAELFSLTDCH